MQIVQIVRHFPLRTGRPFLAHTFASVGAACIARRGGVGCVTFGRPSSSVDILASRSVWRVPSAVGRVSSKMRRYPPQAVPSEVEWRIKNSFLEVVDDTTEDLGGGPCGAHAAARDAMPCISPPHVATDAPFARARCSALCCSPLCACAAMQRGVLCPRPCATAHSGGPTLVTLLATSGGGPFHTPDRTRPESGRNRPKSVELGPNR